jgi:acetyl-CoA synthetase
MPEFAPSVLAPVGDYDALCRRFRWAIPAQFNIAVAVCDRWAEREPRRIAILHQHADGRIDAVDYGTLREMSNRLANTLRAHGIARGDRVALLLPQMPEVAAIHIAIYKLGAIALPLAALFGPDAISYRLQNSGAKALITDAQGLAKLAGIRELLPALALVLAINDKDAGVFDFHATLARAAAHFLPEATTADDPAMMIYTSGTTGPPKGALEPHRVLLGHLPGVEFVHEFFPQAGDLLWTPADWAWAGGLLNVLLPGLYYGVPVVARRFEKFDPEEAYATRSFHRPH